MSKRIIIPLYEEDLDQKVFDLKFKSFSLLVEKAILEKKLIDSSEILNLSKRKKAKKIHRRVTIKSQDARKILSFFSIEARGFFVIQSINEFLKKNKLEGVCSNQNESKKNTSENQENLIKIQQIKQLEGDFI